MSSGPSSVTDPKQEDCPACRKGQTAKLKYEDIPLIKATGPCMPTMSKGHWHFTELAHHQAGHGRAIISVIFQTNFLDVFLRDLQLVHHVCCNTPISFRMRHQIFVFRKQLVRVLTNLESSLEQALGPDGPDIRYRQGLPKVSQFVWIPPHCH